MLGLYLAALLFGGILIGSSLLLGGHDGGDADHDHDHDHDVGDHDHDVDHDVDADHDHEPNAVAEMLKADPGSKIWLPFLSMRFWTFFTAVLGATGVPLTLFGVSDLVTALVAFPFALLVGTIAAWFFLQIRSDRVTADTSLMRFVGQEARVVIPVRPGDVGKIAVQSMAGRVEMPAKSGDGKVLDAGTTVLVAHVQDGVADVTSLSLGRKPAESNTVRDGT